MKTAQVNYPIEQGYVFSYMAITFGQHSLMYANFYKEAVESRMEPIYDLAVRQINALSTIEKLLIGWPIEEVHD